MDNNNIINLKIEDDTQLRQMVLNKFHLLFSDKFLLKKVIEYERILKIIDCIILILSWTGVILSLIASEYNLEFFFVDGSTDLDKCSLRYEIADFSTTLVLSFRITNAISTAIILGLLVYHYMLRLQIDKLKNNCDYDIGLWGSGLWKFLLLELFVNVWTMIPGFNWTIEISQRDANLPKAPFFVDIMVTLLQMFCRSYHPVKYMIIHSQYFQYDCEKVCSECGVSIDYLFAIKAEFNEHPFIFVSILLFISIVVFGYAVRSVEMFFMLGAGSSVKDWRSCWNGFWCVIITMTTVGFGDFFPISILGRSIVVICSFWGAFCISLMVAALTIAVDFNSQEGTAYENLKVSLAEIEYAKVGTIFFQTLIRFNNHLNKAKRHPELYDEYSWKKKKSDLFSMLMKDLHRFRSFKKKKNVTLNSIQLDQSIRQITHSLNNEMDKITSQLVVVYELSSSLNEYKQRQEKIKQECVEIYKELEEIKVYKDCYHNKDIQ